MGEFDKNLRPAVSVGVLIFKDGKVLLGKRKVSHAEGEYAPPGGAVEHLESLIDCARREVKEETGLEIKNLRFLCLYNEKAYAPKHFVNIGFVADWQEGEPRVMEPEKCAGWGWYGMESLPKPLFANMPSYVESYKAGKNFYDA